MGRIADWFWISVISCLRQIALAFPFARGLWRCENWVNGAARRVRGHRVLRIRSFDGRRFAVDVRERQYQMGLLGLGVFEPLETQTVSALVRIGDVVFDVGANYGWYATLFSRLAGARGSVHAFEPVPSNFVALSRNCALNRCANVSLNECAVSDAAGETILHYFPGDACGNATMYKESARSSVELRCKVTTLDTYYRESKSTACDFIKCDVEGAELQVFEGAAGLLEKHQPIILVELNPPLLARASTTPGAVLDEIARRGPYKFYCLDDAALRPIGRSADCNALQTYVNVVCVSGARERDLARRLATVGHRRSTSYWVWGITPPREARVRSSAWALEPPFILGRRRSCCRQPSCCGGNATKSRSRGTACKWT